MHAPAPPTAVADGERRQLTALFCDLVGSTEIASQLDAEEWRDIAAEYQRCAAAAVTRFGGHVDKFLGDGLVCFFGVPQAHEDDAERAVRAGLAIVETVHALTARLGAQHGAPLRVRVGIHTGAAVVAQGGGDAQDVFGDTPNIAARVQTVAEPDSVLITAATQRLVAGLFVVNHCGAQRLKGVPEPVLLYRVRQPSGVHGRLAAGAARGLTPFVGRDDERRLLLNRWERAQDGDGHIVLIAGEAGIGKSRLVQDFKEHLGTTPHTWIECACSQYLQDTPFAPLVDLVEQRFQWAAELLPEERVATLEQACVFAGLDPGKAVPLLAPLLSLPIPERCQPLLVTAEEQRRRLMTTIVEATLAGARLQPLVVVMEDLHWMDPSTLELVRLLVDQLATARMLLVLTARPEFRPPWPLRAHHAQVTLTRLTRRETHTMLVQLAAQIAARSELVEALAARTDGVPLFVEELARAAAEGVGAVGVQEIPVTLKDTLMARLDRLGDAKAIAQAGAVLGREFAPASVAALTDRPDAQVTAGLERLVEAELVHARGLGDTATYIFKHALVQEAAYESLLKSRRRELHRRAAAFLEQNDPSTPAAVRARHWEAAGEAPRAVDAWEAAAAAAQRTAAAHEAAELYERALAVLATLPESPERTQRELTLQTALALLLTATRGLAAPATQAATARARALAEQVGDATQVTLTLAASAYAPALARGEHRAALAVAEQMATLAERDGSVVLSALCHSFLGLSSFYLGDLSAARAHMERVVAVYDAAAFEMYPMNPATVAHSFLGNIAYLSGHADKARACVRAMLNAARPAVVGDTAYVEMMLLALAAIRREPTDLSDRARELLRLCREQQLDMYRAYAHSYGGWVLACEGERDEGLALMREGLRQAQADNNIVARALQLALLAEVLADGGAYAEALATLEDAFGAMGEEAIWRPDLLRLRGDLLAATDPATAEVAYREAITSAEALGAVALALRAATGLAQLLKKLGRAAEERDLLAPLCAT
ncbi:MAG TPA: AAA family ATPase [Candidatus Margulisiibacteriota bacterium]|nr:AAA family ATPase [Candidatus Margulisiibacteriota bacterium]